MGVRGHRIRRMLRFTGRIPTRYKLLYPFWLSAQLYETRETAFFASLPAVFDGFTIAYASDIHYGPFLGEDRAVDLARRLNAMQADLILLGGDYGEDTATSLALFDVLPALRAPYGVLAAIGNHDHMGDGASFERLLDTIKKWGAYPLLNDARVIIKGGASLCVCATDDIKEGHPKFSALTPHTQGSDFVLFAPHSPDIIPSALKQGHFDFDLVITGHTHGGQVAPFSHTIHSSSRYGDRYRSGWMEEEGKRIFVSNGVGTSLLPVRLGAPAQIHHITLRKEKTDR